LFVEGLVAMGCREQHSRDNGEETISNGHRVRQHLQAFRAFPAQKLNNLPDWIAHLLKLGDLSVLWMMLSGLDSFGLV
jgi:hypothetical protein